MWWRVMRFIYAIPRAWRNVRRGCRNIVIWVPVIWDDIDYDYGPLLRVIHKKLTKMERFNREHGYQVRAEQDAAKMKICVLLLDRILADDYSPAQWKSGQQAEDARYLFELMGKHVLTWWD